MSPTTAQVAVGPPEADPSAGRILVVDDNEANRLLAARMLERLGFSVEVAEDGREALARLEAGPYDVVLMDCQMPGMDGYEATAEIRNREGGKRHVAIVAMTAGATQWNEQICRDTGMDAFLGKPVDWRAAASLLARFTTSARPRPGGGRPAEPGEERVSAAREASTREPALDAAILAEIATLDPGGTGVLEELLTAFVEDAGLRVARLRAAAKGDGAGLATTAHSLRGSGLSFGALALAGLCAELEAAATAGNRATIAGLLHELEEELGRVTAQLAARGGKGGAHGANAAAGVASREDRPGAA